MVVKHNTGDIYGTKMIFKNIVGGLFVFSIQIVTKGYCDEGTTEAKADQSTIPPVNSTAKPSTLPAVGLNSAPGWWIGPVQLDPTSTTNKPSDPNTENPNISFPTDSLQTTEVTPSDVTSGVKKENQTILSATNTTLQPTGEADDAVEDMLQRNSTAISLSDFQNGSVAEINFPSNTFVWFDDYSMPNQNLSEFNVNLTSPYVIFSNETNNSELQPNTTTSSESKEEFPILEPNSTAINPIETNSFNVTV